MNDWSEAEQCVERAHEFFELGRWDDAESELRTALSLNPYQPEWHFNLGLTLDAAGRHADAADAFDEAFWHDSANEQALLMAGAALLRADKAEAALHRLGKAIELDPDLVDAWAFRIDALSALGRHDDAEEAFYQGQQVDPDNADLYASMAESLLDRGLTDKAVWCLKEAARLNPSIPRIEARLASAYVQTGRHERARQMYLRELRRDPGDIDTLLDLGDLLFDMNRLAEAREKYGRVLELEPDNADAHAALGELYAHAGADTEAIVEFDLVVRLDPSDGISARRLAGLLLRSGTDECNARARRLLEGPHRAHRMDPAALDADALHELGALLLDADRSRDAIRVFTTLTATHKDDALAWHRLAVAQFEAELMEEGLASARRAIRLNPRSVPAMHNLAVAHIRSGQIARARYWIRQALALDPDAPPIRRLRGVLVAHAVTRAAGRLSRFIAGTPRLAVGLLRRPTRRPTD